MGDLVRLIVFKIRRFLLWVSGYSKVTVQINAANRIHFQQDVIVDELIRVKLPPVEKERDADKIQRSIDSFTGADGIHWNPFIDDVVDDDVVYYTDNITPERMKELKKAFREIQEAEERYKLES